MLVSASFSGQLPRGSTPLGKASDLFNSLITNGFRWCTARCAPSSRRSFTASVSVFIINDGEFRRVERLFRELGAASVSSLSSSGARDLTAWMSSRGEAGTDSVQFISIGNRHYASGRDGVWASRDVGDFTRDVDAFFRLLG
jgi:hypothetical protein